MSEESKDLVRQPQTGGGLVQVGDLLAVAARPDCDPAKAREIYAFAKEVMADQNRQEWTRAFIAAKEELDGIKIHKNGAIVYEGKPGKASSTVKFMKYDDIAEAVKPVLRKHGLTAAYTYRYETTPPKTICIMKLMHTNGHVEMFESPPLPMVDDGGGKNSIQGAGSVGTYGRRYVVCPTFDIVAEGEDDDGNLGRKGPQPISPEEIETINNIVQACEDKNPGFRKLFTTWMVKELKISNVSEITEGNSLKAVRTKLDEKQKILGLL